jgi:amino acid adenylation domain-containing protein
LGLRRPNLGRKPTAYEDFTHLAATPPQPKVETLIMADSILIKTGPDCYPLSPMQQGMLFHNLYAQHPGVDVEQVLVELREDMKPAAFERAWQHVAERHEILRTGFHWQGTGRPYQEVQRHVHIHLDQVDWRDVPARKRGDALESILRVERCRGFNLTVPPLVRLTLIRLGQARYQFIFTFHHLLLDARSIALLLREVFDVYDAFRQEREPRSPFSRPYRDYIDWLQKQDLSKAEAFWRETLKGFTTPTSLNVAGAALETGELKEPRAEQEITLDERVTASLQAFAAENKFTLNTMLQGAWALLLSRYRDEEDVAFGAVRACRRSSIEGADSIVGLFINTVPMRVRVVPDMTVVAWLQQLRSQWIALRDYEHTPLASIQSWSEVADGQPLFESLLNFQDPGWEASLRALGGKWSGRQFGIRSQPNYPLALDASAGPGLLIKILYDRHRFDDSAIQRMLGHLKTLLEGLAAQPHQPLCSLPLLTTAERHQLLETWNATSAELPADKCVHELFEEQARRTPDALAVADEALQLTYRELNTQADAVASRLHGLGVGPDALVGVCIPRSVEMVVALLGVLKAGGAYVPLDPTYPPERLALVLEDSRAPVLLTTKTLRSQFESRVSNVNVVCVDEAPPASTTSLCTPVPHTRNLAYVIYTSGSTGTPKGVAIEHRSLVNLIAWHQREYAVKASDRATQVASPAFDASVWEIWPYLTAGASIHIPDEETRVSPGKLLPWLAGKRITLSFIPTPLAEAMLNEPWPEGCALRALLTGGDKLHRCPGEQFACPLINHYGPTENTVVTTSAAVPRGVSNATAMPPIGRPSSNTQVYVLDRHLQLAPIGVAGELHIGGAGLARGYLNRPGLTAEKFIRNPFNGDPDSRLYKTGDLVRWLPDGNLEFLGRIDHQVKVRGNRIELGEIESVLGRHPAVRQSIVLLRGDGRDDKRLLAWVVPALEQLPTSENLREFLRQKLPDYMLPAAFVFLDTLPLTPNGKVDRAALQSPELDTKSESAFARPRTSTEEMLAGIWWAVLGVKQIGVHDNFFALGGHSLLAAQVISRVRNAFQVELPLRDLFDAPTVAGLAQRIDAAVRGAQGLHCQPLTPLAGNAGWPVAFAQERLWFFEQLEPGKPFNNIPVAVRLTGALNLEALEHSLGEIVRRHAALRTTFTNHQGRPKAVPNPPQPLALNVTDLTSLSPDEREAAAKQLT